MRIVVSSALTAKRLGKPDIVIGPDDLSSVHMMGGSTYDPPTFIKKIFKTRATLQYIILEHQGDQLTLAARDTGFNEAVLWLENNGWETGEAIRKSVAQPYIRISVARAE